MQVTKTVYLIAQPVTSYDFTTGDYEDKIDFSVWCHDKYLEHEAITSMEVTFEVPDDLNYFDLKLQELQKAKTAIQAEFTAKLTEIQSQINKHLAIEAQ